MNKCYFLVSWLLILTTFTHGQESSQSKSFTINNKVIVKMQAQPGDLDPVIENRVLPKPHPGADRILVEGIKNDLNKYRSRRGHLENNGQKTQNANPPVMLRNFIGNIFNGFVPNDNDIAISNGDQVCSVSNTTIWSRDQQNNVTYGSFNLHTLTISLGLQQEEFDPKIIYDPGSNRFIMVCLNGFNDTTSNVLVGFSQDSTSFNNWNFYALPGNPLNNNLWTDFPMISVTDDEVFITVNLLYNDSSWQVGFNQTVIWQIDKNEGYSGSTLNPLLHYDIKYNNEALRNLCPVKGGSSTPGPNQFFLSNRNFAMENDTIFIVDVSGTINSNPVVSVGLLSSNVGYRMPVNALQTSADSLIVNDARILGAFYENGKIQFVFNTLDTVSGQVGIFHGIIDMTGMPAIDAVLYVNDTLDLAYPNIAYAGTGPGDDRAIVSVLMSSPTNHPGTAAFKYDGAGLYSPITVVKSGVGYTNMLVGNERWGDYTGCQTRYNMPGYVWVNGSYSQINHTTRTYVAELTVDSLVSTEEISHSPDDFVMYPNPSADRVSISFEKQNDGWISINILDMQGKLVVHLYAGSITAGRNSFSFNASSLSNGSYLLSITDNTQNKIAVKQFIKN